MPQRRGFAERRIEPEWLDEPTGHDPSRNLRDLARINRWFGGRSALLRRLSEVVDPSEKFDVLDVGAASGDMGEAVREHYPLARVVSLDRRARHLANCSGERLAADAFRLPFAPASFDIVMANLFLHHFSESEIVTLLREFAVCARRAVVVVDLLRHPLAAAFLPATRPVLRWDPMTVHDGVISVRSAFLVPDLVRYAELARLKNPRVAAHYPWFRVSMVVRV